MNRKRQTGTYTKDTPLERESPTRFSHQGDLSEIFALVEGFFERVLILKKELNQTIIVS